MTPRVIPSFKSAGSVLVTILSGCMERTDLYLVANFQWILGDLQRAWRRVAAMAGVLESLIIQGGPIFRVFPLMMIAWRRVVTMTGAAKSLGGRGNPIFSSRSVDKGNSWRRHAKILTSWVPGQNCLKTRLRAVAKLAPQIAYYRVVEWRRQRKM